MVIDLTGKTFGYLTVLRRAENNSRGDASWLCRCKCGNEKVILGKSLRSGATVSCGCYHKEVVAKQQTTHGGTKTRLFTIWQNMKRRCYNQNYKFYEYYGGRGITICDEWLNDFVSFRDWAVSAGYNDTLTIDRIDSDGNYEPSNCRWISRKAQVNNCRSNRVYEINGERKTIAEWCEIYGVPHERTRRRVVNEGWDILDALTTPPLKRNGKPR